MERLTPGEAGYYLGANRDVATALGIPVVPSAVLERGAFLMDKTGSSPRLIVGTRVELLDDVRREARRIVRAGMARVTPHALAYEHRRQLEAEHLVDHLAGLCAGRWDTCPPF